MNMSENHTALPVPAARGLRGKPLMAALPLALLGAAYAVPAQAALEWTLTELQYRYGDEFREHYNPNDIAKNSLKVKNVSGFSFGRTMAYVDLRKSDSKDQNANASYGEAYVTFSMGRLTGKPWSAGIVKDVGLTAGINLGQKDYPTYDITTRAYLPGVTLDFNLPGFNYIYVDVLGFVNRSKFDGKDDGCNASTYQLAPNWSLPIAMGAAKFSFEGYVYVIGSHGNCERQVISQPQLRWDVGNHFGRPDKFYAGIEYQYYHNKYGIRGLKESFPQLLLVGKF